MRQSDSVISTVLAPVPRTAAIEHEIHAAVHHAEYFDAAAAGGPVRICWRWSRSSADSGARSVHRSVCSAPDAPRVGRCYPVARRGTRARPGESMVERPGPEPARKNAESRRNFACQFFHHQRVAHQHRQSARWISPAFGPIDLSDRRQAERIRHQRVKRVGRDCHDTAAPDSAAARSSASC